MRSMLLQPFLYSILAGMKFCLVLDLTNHMFILYVDCYMYVELKFTKIIFRMSFASAGT
jgi:hypothetical protein